LLAALRKLVAQVCILPSPVPPCPTVALPLFIPTRPRVSSELYVGWRVLRFCVYVGRHVFV